MKKKVPEKISKKKIGPNRVINPQVHGFEKMFFFSYLKKNEKKNRPTGGVVPQGGLQGGVGRLILGERP